MGTFQLSELRTEILLHFANRSDEQASEARITRAINIAQERMARAYSFEEMEVIASGTLPFTSTPTNDKYLAFTSLPAGMTEPRKIYSFRLITGDGRSRKLIKWSARQFDRFVPEPQFFGVKIPTNYVKYADKFEFHPVQDQAYPYEIRMTKWPTALASDSDKSDFNRKDELIMQLVISWLWDSVGEYERAKRFFAIFDTLWKEAVAEDMENTDRDTSPVGGKHIPTLAGEYWRNPFVKSVQTGL